MKQASSDLNQKLIRSHNRWNRFILTLKIMVLTCQRSCLNIWFKIKSHPQTHQLTQAPILAEVTSTLWTNTAQASDWMLTAGKIENIRVATRRLHGLYIPAGQVFSFWTHIGHPNRWKGYVYGREIQQGCLVPSIAGGICQVSNGLYEAALKAGLEIIERYEHSHKPIGSQAKKKLDATVKWNYIDLRFKADFDWGIEVSFTQDQMKIRIRGYHPKSNGLPILSDPVTVPHVYTQSSSLSQQEEEYMLRNCYSCNQTSCSQNQKHEPQTRQHAKKSQGLTTMILDTPWPEFENYLNSLDESRIHVISPISTHIPYLSRRWGWRELNTQKHQEITSHTSFIQSCIRWCTLKWDKIAQKNLFHSQLHTENQWASYCLKHIPIESTHLIISQTLLPTLYQAGVCAGRTFDVLVTRLPLQKLQQKLDTLHQKYPQSATLNDFRADSDLLMFENQAFKQARWIITPHQYIMKCFPPSKRKALTWHTQSLNEMPQSKTPFQSMSSKNHASNSVNKPITILFPASLLARKGAYDFKKLIEFLRKEIQPSIEVQVMGKAIESQSFIRDFFYQGFTGDWSSITAIIYPTVIEHEPRVLLKALQLNIPVLTTHASGLTEHPSLTLLKDDTFECLQNHSVSWLKKVNKVT